MSLRMNFITLLVLLGLMSVSTLYLVPFETLVPEGTVTLSPTLIKLIMLIQPIVLIVIAIMIGTFLGPKVGLDAPALRALTSNNRFLTIIKPQIFPAVVVGLGVAIIILGFGQIIEPYFSRAESEVLIKALALNPPLITKILYGGVGEELLMRWGLMTLTIWVIWRLKGSQGLPSPKIVWIGIGIAAFLFALGHLPLLFAISGTPPLWIIGAVIIGNVLPGIGFGWLYYRYGLEAAIIAHALGHVFSTIVTNL